MTIIKGVEHLRWLREQAGFEEDAFLRQRGWKHTCDAPGALWLWERVLDGGRVIAVTAEVAIAIEGSLEAGRCLCSGGLEPGEDCPLHGGDW